MYVAMRSRELYVFLLVTFIFPRVMESCVKKPDRHHASPKLQVPGVVRPKSPEQPGISPEESHPCSCVANELSCENKKLSTLIGLSAPPSFCANASIINLRFNDLSRLNFPAGTLLQYVHSTLLLDHNNLVSLEGLEDWSGPKLVVHNNLIEAVDFSRFREHLEELYIDVNLLSTINLTEMKNLRVLSASSNNLSNIVLPAEKCSLRSLDLRENKLSSLPRELENCKDLVELNISRNGFTFLDLSHNSRLTTFSARENRLRQLNLPSKNCSLIVVDVSNNNLTSVPDSLVRCTQLRILSLQKNVMSYFSPCVSQLMTLRPVNPLNLNESTSRHNNSLGIHVNLQENPLWVGEVIASIREYMVSRGFMFYFFTKINFVTNSPVDCTCSEISLDQFSPVTYCVSCMCENGENLWKYL